MRSQDAWSITGNIDCLHDSVGDGIIAWNVDYATTPDTACAEFSPR